MLTDIFALRYEEVKIWNSLGIKERRLIVQSFSIIKDQIAPYYDFDGKESIYGKGLLAWNRQSNETFRGHVEELNTRFRQANCLLQYHNGFIQISEDVLTAEEIETPFWQLLSEADWANVDTDMKQALDLRDSGGRDPAFYAARALESAIKIISEKRGATMGGEKSAYNFIENLASKRGGHFISDWESETLKSFFDKIRNPFGHGPGRADMPSLSAEQTSWAIETCMSWTKSLIRRL